MMSVCLSFLAVTRPTIGQLNKFVIPRVLHKWHDLGLQLLGAGEAERLNSYTGGSQKRCSEMLRVWLQRNPDADWYLLIKALESAQLNNVAGDIRNMFVGELYHI